MSQFYISSEAPEHDLQRCHRSREFRRWLAITGATEEGEIKLFEGVVQSVEDNGENAPKGKRWRVTIVDEGQRLITPFLSGHKYSRGSRGPLAWAKVEEQLFRICVECLKTSDEKTAIVYYRTPSLSARLELLDELVRATLPRKLRKSGGHDLPIVKSWKDIYGEAKNLLGTRRRIAHHPVADRFIFGAPDGTGILGSKTSLEIYESNAERLRGKTKPPKPLGADDLSAHCTKVQAIATRLKTFCSQLSSPLN